MAERLLITSEIKKESCIGTRCPLIKALLQVDQESSIQKVRRILRIAGLEPNQISEDILECRENGRPCGFVLLHRSNDT